MSGDAKYDGPKVVGKYPEAKELVRALGTWPSGSPPPAPLNFYLSRPVYLVRQRRLRCRCDFGGTAARVPAANHLNTSWPGPIIARAWIDPA